MDTTLPRARRSILLLVALTMVVAAGGCRFLDGGGDVEAVGRSDPSGEQSGGVDDPSGVEPTAGVADGSGSDGASATDPQDGVGGSGDVALGEITDPSEIDDPADPADDVAPDSLTPAELRRVRTDIQEFLEQGELRLADDRATSVLERDGLDPGFRLELEAYRDLARAAGAGDRAAADDAVDRLQRFEPGFVDELAARQVLPDGILAPGDATSVDAAAPAAVGAGDDAAVDRRLEVDARLDAVVKALAAQDWKLADRLAAEVLANAAPQDEEAMRARLYGQLAEAHITADPNAIARASKALAAVDPDLARRLAPPSVAIEAEPVAGSGG